MGVGKTLGSFGFLLAALATLVVGDHHAALHHARRVPEGSHGFHSRQSSVGPMVFAHYMLVMPPPNLNFTNDILMAQAAGIDAFAVNFEGPDWALTSGWLTMFYVQAAALNFKLFISIDTTSVTDVNVAVNVTQTFAHWGSQLWIDGQLMVSSFSVFPPGWNWQSDFVDRIGVPVLFVPGSMIESTSSIPPDQTNFGQFTWIHPANPADGPEINGMPTEQSIDEDFAQWQTPSKPWMAAVAPYYFRRLMPDNWLNAQDDCMWVDRWMNLLKTKPAFIEIVTWNDFGESSYIGPANAVPDSAAATTPDYYSNLTHTAFYDMTKIFIKAFKAGQTSVTVQPEDEDVFYMYRMQPKEINGLIDTQAWQGLPKNVTEVSNNVYIFSFLTSPAVIYLKSGHTTYPLAAPAGVSKGTIPFQMGAQRLSANRPLHYGNLQKSGPTITRQLERYNGNVFAI